MKAYTYIEKGHFALIDKPKPTLQESTLCSQWHTHIFCLSTINAAT